MPRPQHSAQSATASRKSVSNDRSIAVVALLVAPLLGCGSKETVRHYRIPKRELLYAANHVEKTEAAADRPSPSTPPADRLLGAIVPHGAQTWYFKMTGPMEAVASQGAAFRQLIESIRFDERTIPAAMEAPGILERKRGVRSASGDTFGGRGRPDVGSVGDSTGHYTVCQLAVGQRQSLAPANAVAADHRGPTPQRDHHAQPRRGPGHAGESAGKFRGRRDGERRARS